MPLDPLCPLTHWASRPHLQGGPCEALAGQQSLEKCFKALLAYEDKEIVPIHNLRRLAEFAAVVHELDESTLLKLDFLSSFYINSRYKEDLQKLSKGINEPMVRDFIQFSEELITWLCQKMK